MRQTVYRSAVDSLVLVLTGLKLYLRVDHWRPLADEDCSPCPLKLPAPPDFPPIRDTAGRRCSLSCSHYLSHAAAIGFHFSGLFCIFFFPFFLATRLSSSIPSSVRTCLNLRSLAGGKHHMTDRLRERNKISVSCKSPIGVYIFPRRFAPNWTSEIRNKARPLSLQYRTGLSVFTHRMILCFTGWSSTPAAP